MTKLTGVVEATAIRPFQLNTPEAELTELRRRILATRFPEKETVTDFSQGVPLATTQTLARAWNVLMKRLGYTSYVAQGGDWGSVVVDYMGVQAPKGLLAIHTNMPGVVPSAIDAAAFARAPVPAGLSADEKHAYEQLAAFYKNVYYAVFMGTRPETLTALADSTVGL